jgi:hypothetical protein
MEDTTRKTQNFFVNSSNKSSLDEIAFTKEIHENQAKVNQSGNSHVNVNVNVEVDTKAIAYAMLCSSLARKELTNDEFEFALNKLEELVQTNKTVKSDTHNQSKWNRLIFRGAT